MLFVFFSIFFHTAHLQKQSLAKVFKDKAEGENLADIWVASI